MKKLRMVEFVDVGVGEGDSINKFLVDRIVSLLYLLVANGKRRERSMVELKLLFLHSLVDILSHIVEHLADSSVESRSVEVWALYEAAPFFFYWIFYDVHVVSPIIVFLFC